MKIMIEIKKWGVMRIVYSMKCKLIFIYSLVIIFYFGSLIVVS